MTITTLPLSHSSFPFFHLTLFDHLKSPPGTHHRIEVPRPPKHSISESSNLLCNWKEEEAIDLEFSALVKVACGDPRTNSSSVDGRSVAPGVLPRYMWSVFQWWSIAATCSGLSSFSSFFFFQTRHQPHSFLPFLLLYNRQHKRTMTTLWCGSEHRSRVAVIAIHLSLSVLP